MNIIRTAAVELSIIPAIAYKTKLASGGGGLKLMRLDQQASATATINKRTGEVTPYGTVDEALFPYEAFEEALELTGGLPYSARGSISLAVSDQPEEEEPASPEPEKIDMVDSAEYQAIVARYSDEKGKMNYRLMNKDFIQFAAKSKVVADLVAKQAQPDDIVLAILKSRATFISGQKESLDDEHVKALLETLDEIDPRSAFKELKSHINRMLARR